MKALPYVRQMNTKAETKEQGLPSGTYRLWKKTDLKKSKTVLKCRTLQEL